MNSILDNDVFAATLGAVAFLGFLMMALGIVMYVFQALGMYTIAKRRGVSNPLFAWFPVTSQWLLGSISDDYQSKVNRRTTKRGLILLILNLSSILLSLINSGLAAGNMASLISGSGSSGLLGFSLSTGSFLSVLISCISITSSVFTYIALHDLYRSSHPNRAVVYTVLGIIFGVTTPFFVFSCRNYDQGMPRRETAWNPYSNPGTWDSNQGSNSDSWY